MVPSTGTPNVRPRLFLWEDDGHSYHVWSTRGVSYLTLAVECARQGGRDGAALPLCVWGKPEAFRVSLEALQHGPCWSLHAG